MRTIGVTGGIASGKSAVMRCLRHMGAVTFSADEAARAVVAPGSPTLARIALAFGHAALLPDGSLDRAYVARRAFADPRLRRILDAITHPPILALLRAQLDAVTSDMPRVPIIAVEAPLLYESGMEGWFDRILAVTADPDARVQRLIQRNALSAEDARLRLAAQATAEASTRRADVVIRNDGGLAELCEQVRAALRGAAPEPIAQPDEAIDSVQIGPNGGRTHD